MTTILLQIVLGLMSLILLLALGLWLIPKVLHGARKANARFEQRRKEFDRSFDERRARVEAELRKPF